MIHLLYLRWWRHGLAGWTDTNMMAGSPMSLYDFYMYLKYIEFSAENLEFYIWSVFFRPLSPRGAFR